MRALTAILLFWAGVPSFGQGVDSVASLLHREDVQAELKLTPGQLKTWGEIDKPPRLRRTGTFEADELQLEDPQAVREREAKREEKAWRLLTPSQVGRLSELYVQRVKSVAVLRSDVQAKLQFTAEQSQAVRVALAGYDMSLRSLIRKRDSVKSELGRLDPQKVRDSVKKIEADLSEQLDAVMTNEQRNDLTACGGKPFRFLERKF